MEKEAKKGETELRHCFILLVVHMIYLSCVIYSYALFLCYSYFCVSRLSCFSAGLFLGVSTQSLSSLSSPPMDNDCALVGVAAAATAVGMFDDDSGRLRDGGRGVVGAGELWVWLLPTEPSTLICFSWYRCNCNNFSSISGLRFSCFRAFLIAEKGREEIQAIM